jgi:hypothetical protein
VLIPIKQKEDSDVRPSRAVDLARSELDIDINDRMGHRGNTDSLCAEEPDGPGGSANTASRARSGRSGTAQCKPGCSAPRRRFTGHREQQGFALVIR